MNLPSNKPKNKNQRKNKPYKLGNGYTTIQKPRFGFLETHMYITFHYAELISVNLTTTVGNYYLFRLNSLYDPNRSGTGTQPYGYDQTSALYNRYRVLKTKWKVSFLASTGTYNCAVMPINGSLATPVIDLSTFTITIMQPFSKYKIYNLGAVAPVFSGQIPLNVLAGATKTEYLADDRYEALNSASPGEQLDLCISYHNPTGGTIVLAYMVELWFESDLHDPITVGASSMKNQQTPIPIQ